MKHIYDWLHRTRDKSWLYRDISCISLLCIALPFYQIYVDFYFYVFFSNINDLLCNCLRLTCVFLNVFYFSTACHQCRAEAGDRQAEAGAGLDTSRAGASKRPAAKQRNGGKISGNSPATPHESTSRWSIDWNSLACVFLLQSGTQLNNTLAGLQGEKETLHRTVRQQEAELASLRQQAQLQQSSLEQERQRSSMELGSLHAQLQQQVLNCVSDRTVKLSVRQLIMFVKSGLTGRWAGSEAAGGAVLPAAVCRGGGRGHHTGRRGQTGWPHTRPLHQLSW